VPGSVRRSARRALALTTASALAIPWAVGALGSPAAAQSGDTTLTVPSSAGQSVTAEFDGTAPPAAFANSECPADGTLSDVTSVDLVVPDGTYDRLNVRFETVITWDPVAANDLILTIVRDGQVVGNVDGGAPKETVTLSNPEGGSYQVIVCGFASATPQPYAGTLTLATTAIVRENLPTVETGLEFGASLVTDPQRSQGESAAFADADGVLYSCGTNGFSNATDHGSVSVDGGETWRPLGTPPVGETGTIQGGGDCAVATGAEPNADGRRQLAFIGLGPLTGFSTFTSPDYGRTIQRSADQNGLVKTNQQSLVDRQWLTFTDEKTVFLNYNAALVSLGDGGQIVQRSDDGGLTFGPAETVSTDGSRLGQIRSIPPGTVPGVSAPIVYFPYNSGNLVKLAMSQDGGETWSQCVAVDAQIDPTAGFVAADHDLAGNIYVTYAEKGGGRDTYLVALRAADVAKCKGTFPVTESAKNLVNPGFTKKIRVNREGVETTVMPWVAAGGQSGRVAVSFYGTDTVGDPDSGEFDAAWHVYVTQTIDAFATEPQLDQAQATTHPNHYDSICLNGLGCSVSMGDRSLVDFFSMTYDPARGRLVVVYNQAAKTPDDEAGNIAAPVALIQRAGPSHRGGEVSGGPPVLRTATTDTAEDAFARWTTSDGYLGSPTTELPGGNVPALDLQEITVGPEVDLETGEEVADGGFTVTMRYADLSTAALTSALTSAQGSSLVYLFRFFDGYQPGGVAAYYEPAAGGWRFGYNDYETTVRNPQGNIQTYRGNTPVPGAVNADAGTITLSVPRELIEALGPDDEGGRPTEVPATDGSRVYDASAWTFVNQLPTSREQTFLTQADNTAAFDFLVGRAGVDAPTAPQPQPRPLPQVPPDVPLPSTGGLGVPVLALLLLTASAWAVRRRRGLLG
jgi:hypothetical protein